MSLQREWAEKTLKGEKICYAPLLYLLVWISLLPTTNFRARKTRFDPSRAAVFWSQLASIRMLRGACPARIRFTRLCACLSCRIEHVCFRLRSTVRGEEKYGSQHCQKEKRISQSRTPEPVKVLSSQLKMKMKSAQCKHLRALPVYMIYLWLLS